MPHRAHASEIGARARVQRSGVYCKPIRHDGQINGDIAVDTAHTIDVPRESSVIRGVGNVEERGAEQIFARLAWVQRGGLEHVLGGREWGEGEEKGAY